MFREELLEEKSSTGSFLTPVSSVDDLMSLSPRRNNCRSEMKDDFLTGLDFQDNCDVTMREACDDVFLAPNDLDYLTECTENSANHTISKMDRGKESLFVKFDPLYIRNKQRNKLNHTINIPERDIGYETGSSTSTVDQVNTIPTGPLLTESMFTNFNKEKPTQVVPPAVNHTVIGASMPQSRAVPALVRSISAISAPSHVAVDRLINYVGCTPPVRRHSRSPQLERADSSDRIYSLRVILQKQEEDIHILQHENRELKYQLLDKENNHMRHLKDVEATVKKVTEEKEKLMENQIKLTAQINAKMKSNKQMSSVMEEYEKTISTLIEEQQKKSAQHKELEDKLILERDEALNHLASMEGSFNDLLAKYEKCKSIIFEAKEREKTYEQQISEYKSGIEKYDSLYENLKTVTSESLSKSNEALDNIKKSHSIEVAKYNATIKKQEIMILSLQESLLQKERDNQQLTSICDDLINKVH